LKLTHRIDAGLQPTAQRQAFRGFGDASFAVLELGIDVVRGPPFVGQLARAEPIAAHHFRRGKIKIVGKMRLPEQPDELGRPRIVDARDADRLILHIALSGVPRRPSGGGAPC
jgi:hypothetical protein